jgi:hypothetical protein
MHHVPPKLAIWFLTRLTRNDALAGDVIEQYSIARRSRLWFWRQVLLAIIVGFWHEVVSHKLRTVGALTVTILVWDALNLSARVLMSQFVRPPVMTVPCYCQRCAFRG